MNDLKINIFDGSDYSELHDRNDFVLIFSATGTKYVGVPNVSTIRHYYRNEKRHPSRIVRMYRRTRTWLTDHFIISDRRIENIYSFSLLAIIFIATVYIFFFDLFMKGASGQRYDDNSLEKYKK